MNPPVLPHWPSWTDFVAAWRQRYTDRTKDALYLDRINEQEFDEEDIWKLFAWKNETGGTFNRKKAKSIRENVLAKLDTINQLKASFDKPTFDREFKDWNPEVWKPFLLHIIAPTRFPVYDARVLAAFAFTKTGSAILPQGKNDRQALFYDEYVPFFNTLASQGIDRKQLDEALWAFGRWIIGLPPKA